jgi:hypothetical protein
MAVSKHTRVTGCEPNPFFLELFRDRSGSHDEREQQWTTAMSHAGEGNPPLRFPVYGSLYLINAYSQKLVDLLDEACEKFGVRRDLLVLYQAMIQSVRAGASHEILDLMNGVEVTEGWLFEQQRRREEQDLRDPGDAYLEVRRLEAERKAEGRPPRVRFLDEEPVEPAGDSDEPV